MTIQDLRDRKLIIMETIVGSQAYGISTPTSDIDIKGVFVQPLDDILRNGYIDQVSDETNDTTFYEIKRFFQLLKTNNPTILELLASPADCILHEDPIFSKYVTQHKDKFLTKICKMSFGGYAVEQIKKARGLNKKIVNPVDLKRKDVLDFCYVALGQKSILVKEYLEDRGMKQEYCGLVSLPHMRYVYAVFYDRINELANKGIKFEFQIPPKYKGIVKDIDKANDISLSSIPKGVVPEFHMYFNKDAYQIHCKEYREYFDWVKKRNKARFDDNALNGKGFDGKNIAHCHRLLDMSIEIGERKGVIVKRPNREELLAIRRGEFDYDYLIAEANKKIEKMNDVYENSDLPETVDSNFIDDLLLAFRKEYYMIKKIRENYETGIHAA